MSARTTSKSTSTLPTRTKRSRLLLNSTGGESSSLGRDGCEETDHSRADGFPTTGTDDSKILEKSLINTSFEIDGEC